MPLIFHVIASAFLLAGFVVLSTLAAVWHVWPLACVGTAGAVAGSALAARARCRWQRAARYLDTA